MDMSGPERIWAEQTDTADQNWRTHDRFGGVEYLRADLATAHIEAAVRLALEEATETLQPHWFHAPMYHQQAQQAIRALNTPGNRAAIIKRAEAK